MCFGSCRVTCDNCKPKFVYCPNCGNKCMLFHKACKRCKTELTEEMKQQARDEWQIRAKERHDKEVDEQSKRSAAKAPKVDGPKGGAKALAEAPK